VFSTLGGKKRGTFYQKKMAIGRGEKGKRGHVRFIHSLKWDRSPRGKGSRSRRLLRRGKKKKEKKEEWGVFRVEEGKDWGSRALQREGGEKRLRDSGDGYNMRKIKGRRGRAPTFLFSHNEKIEKSSMKRWRKVKSTPYYE